MKLVFWGVMALMSWGCVNVATSAIGVATEVGETAAKTTANAANAGVNAAVSKKSRKTRKQFEHEEPRPFDETSDPNLDIDVALAQAERTGKRVLLIFGGNWCHDSRGLAAKFEEPELATVIRENFELVWIDIGFRDRNMNVLRGFGVNRIYGTPVVLILSPSGDILNGDTIHDWRAADSRSYREAYEYFQSFAIVEKQRE